MLKQATRVASAAALPLAVTHENGQNLTLAAL